VREDIADARNGLTDELIAESMRRGKGALNASSSEFGLHAASAQAKKAPR